MRAQRRATSKSYDRSASPARTFERPAVALRSSSGFLGFVGASWRPRTEIAGLDVGRILALMEDGPSAVCRSTRKSAGGRLRILCTGVSLGKAPLFQPFLSRIFLAAFGLRNDFVIHGCEPLARRESIILRVERLSGPPSRSIV